ncbi:MAG: exo-alpha-sialidase [candidate division Zixibacteria bacterium]|nr:exo-alpha-sialidase [candidate division Zixibacteria bacterium]
MTSYSFDHVTVDISTPTVIGQRTGHLWFTTLHPFNHRDILCIGNIAADEAQGDWAGALYLSRDGGASWQPAGDLKTCGPASYGLAANTRLIMPYELWPLKRRNRRNLVADGTIVRLDAAGRVSTQPVPVQFLDFPVDFADYHTDELALLTNGNILPLRDGRLMTTLYGTLLGEQKYRLYAITSGDGGFTWRYHAQVASWEDIPDGPEGPDESHTTRLADGRLLCVYRVGSRREYPLHKSYSADDGLSWSKPEKMEGVWSVEPQIARLDNGLMVLSSGRPGLFLWVCTDEVGNQWERINLAEHHNAHLADSSLHYNDAFCAGEEVFRPYQSTSYTGMIRSGADQVLISYERTANGWDGAPGPYGDTDAAFCIRVRARR